MRIGLAAVGLALAAAWPSVPAAQTLQIGIYAEPDTLDPDQANTVAARFVFTALCDKLIDIDADLNFVPQLAESWSWSEDQSSIAFKLRPGVVFHDGEKFDAAAVKANIERSLNLPESRRKSEIDAIKSVEVVDDLTVRLVTGGPFAPLLAQLADRSGMMISPKAAEAAGADFGNNPVCSGPFKFTERVAQDRIVLDRFENYWNKDRIHLDRVVFKPIPDTTVRLLNLQSGDLDMIERLAATDMAAVEADPNLQLITSTGLGHVNIVVNTGAKPAADNPLGQDPRVREALELAIDREALNAVAFEGANTVGNQPQPPGNPYHITSLPAPARNVERAKQLLKEAGVPNPTIELLVPNTTEFVSAAQIIQSMAAEAGFNLEIKVQEFAAALDLFNQGNFQAFLVSWSGRVDPDANIYPFTRTDAAINPGRYSNPRVDELLDQARTKTDQAERYKLYEEAIGILLDERPRIYLYHENNRFALRDGIEGFVPVPDGLIRFTDLKK